MHFVTYAFPGPGNGTEREATERVRASVQFRLSINRVQSY